MLCLIKKGLFTGLTFLSALTGVNSLSCISMNNPKLKVRLQITNVNSNEPVLFPLSIKTSKCSGSGNKINDLYTKIMFLML